MSYRVEFNAPPDTMRQVER